MKNKVCDQISYFLSLSDRIVYNELIEHLYWNMPWIAPIDKTIQGRELLDDPSAVERIPEDEWNEEIREEALE